MHGMPRGYAHVPSLSLATLLHISVYTWSGISAFDMKTKEHVGQDSKGLAVLSRYVDFGCFFPVSLFYFLFSRILSLYLFLSLVLCRASKRR